MITIFKDGYDLVGAKYVNIDTALTRIRDGKSKQKIEEIRNYTDPKEISKLKMNLPSVLFHGVFNKEITKVKSDGTSYQSKRDDSSISSHSGFLILDFDKCDVASKKRQLSQDPYVYACWVSPSGSGVKALVRCEASIEKHYILYDNLIERYPDLDTTSRSLSRLCFESYDPDIYINPNAKVWDKSIVNLSKNVTDETRLDYKDKQRVKRGNAIISRAVDMIRSSYDGTKHETVLKAGKLVGGYIATNNVDETAAISVLTEEIIAKNPKDLTQAKKTLLDGINYGKNAPLYETKKIGKELEYVKREDGNFDFIADDEEMDDYETRFLNGTLEMGLSTGYPELDKYWMAKRNHVVWIAGADGSGKSFWAWYEAVLIAIFHDWKALIHSAENSDGQVRKKLKEYYLGKSLKSASKEELQDASEFIKKHFKIMTSRKLHTWEDFLIKCEIVYDEGYEYDLVIADPFNAFDIPDAMDSHRHNLKALNIIRTFKENYSAIWVIDHIGSQGTRNRDTDNNMQVPHKAAVDGGQIKANKTDDFIIVHRNSKKQDLDPDLGIPAWQITEIHVDKIKDTETGGKPSPKDEPFKIVLNADKCGFTCNGRDAVKEYWENKRQAVVSKSIGIQSYADSFLSETFEINNNDEAPF